MNNKTPQTHPDDYFTLSDIAKHVPEVHRKTLNKWVTRGVSGKVLHAKKIGRSLFTTLNHLQEFLNGEDA